MDWFYIEEIHMSKKDLEIGMETDAKTWEQLEKDISRICIYFNGTRMTEPNYLSAKVGGDMDVLRYCTQSIFFNPLDRLTNIFKQYILTHPRGEISINIDQHCCSGVFCRYFSSNHSSLMHFKISTKFRAVHPRLFTPCFDISCDTAFVYGEEVGLLSYRVSSCS